jgi:GntR family transcriptional regulator
MNTKVQIIDFESPIPYYIQLISLINAKIDAGDWKPGDQLPSEPDMCDIYGVSRTVVRQALREMELEGRITRRKGKGTFVAEPKINENLAQKLTGFYHDMVERGFQPVTNVLSHKRIKANQKVASFLEIEPGREVFEIERLRSVNDEPIVLVTTYLPCSLCPKLEFADLSEISLYDFLETECDLFISTGKRYIEAVIANEREAQLLGVDTCAPLISLDSVSYLDSGTAIEYFHAIHRGDRSRFEVKLVRSKETGNLREAIGIDEKNLPSSN